MAGCPVMSPFDGYTRWKCIRPSGHVTEHEGGVWHWDDDGRLGHGRAPRHILGSVGAQQKPTR